MTAYISNASNKVFSQNYKHVDHSAIQMNWTRRHAGASFGLAGGFIVGFLGLFLAATALITGGAGESHAATGLIIAALPLLVFGAHSLDKIDEEDKAQRLARCKKLGLTEKECRAITEIGGKK